MIHYTTGNIFQSNAMCLVNPVNTVGVMGAGLALQFKRKFPKMFSEYHKMCNDKTLRKGTVGFWINPLKAQMVCLFPTKEHYREDSTVEIVEASLKALEADARRLNIDSIGMPLVGCGLGELDFNRDVRPLIEKVFQNSKIDVTVYLF
jgi:O-acetyl-ADP-ribose deacetylase (regulator of RNase III)